MATNVSFTPDVYNVTWDGTSPAEVTFGLKCGGSGSYSAVAHRVFDKNGSYPEQLDPQGATEVPELPFRAGDRYFVVHTYNTGYYTRDYAPDQTMTASVVGSTGVSVRFSSLGFTTTEESAAYSWVLTNSNGGVDRLLAAGKLLVTRPNPYKQSSQSSNTFISGMTMTSAEC